MTKRRCKAITSSGTRCKNNAVDGSDYCHIPSHQEEVEEIDYESMNLEELKDHMTEKQKRFADYYIEEANAKLAAVKAGYSEDSAKQIGNENLSKPYLRCYVDKILESKDNDRIASQDEVLEFLTRVMRSEEMDIITGTTKEGVPIKFEAEPNIAERRQAAKLLGKRYSLFKDKVEHSGDVGVKIIDDIE